MSYSTPSPPSPPSPWGSGSVNPYDLAGTLKEPRRPDAPYRSLAARARVAAILLSGLAVLDLAGIGCSLYAWHYLQLSAQGAEFGESARLYMLLPEAAVSIAGMVLSVLIAVPFCMWFYRAHENLPALWATDLKYSPGWAAGSFFVPFLNLVRPYQVMLEVWQGSHPDHLMAEPDKSSSLVRSWWAMFLLRGFIFRVATRLGRGDGIPDLIHSHQALIVAHAISALAALVAIRLIVAITARQRDRLARVRDLLAS